MSRQLIAIFVIGAIALCLLLLLVIPSIQGTSTLPHYNLLTPKIYEEDGEIKIVASMYYFADTTNAYIGSRPSSQFAWDLVRGTVIDLYYLSGQEYARVVVEGKGAQEFHEGRDDGSWVAHRPTSGTVFVPISIWEYPFPDGTLVHYRAGINPEDWSGLGELQGGEIVFAAPNG